MQLRRIAFGGLLVMSLAGCDAGPAGIDIQGEITYDKTPVETGIIRFQTSGDNELQPRFVEFENGHYEMKGENAPLPGTYRVEIDGFKRVKEPKAPEFVKDANGMVKKPIVPQKYNLQSELTVEIKEGQSQYDFHLKK